MKIAQIAPLMESVPPRLYGGTERIVFWLTEELVREGHAEIHQQEAFAPIYMRKRVAAGGGGASVASASGGERNE